MTDARQARVGRPGFRVRPVNMTITINAATRKTLKRVAKERGTSISRMLDEWAKTIEITA